MLSLDFFDLLGLAIFGFFTGLGSTFGIEFSKYLLEKMKKNGELLKKSLEPQKAREDSQGNEEADQDPKPNHNHKGQS